MLLKNKITAVLIVVIACLCLCSCGTDDIDVTSYADETITLAGFTDEDIVLTVKDLKGMDCITKKTESTSDKIGEVRATGPTLQTVLNEYGVSQADCSTIHIYARDDYDVKLNHDVLEENDVILAYGIDGEPLEEQEAPVRIIIPQSDSAYWIRMVERIELEE